MYFTGIPANLLSLGALDFGIIVDGTLVMVEHIVHQLARTRAGEAARRPSSRRFSTPRWKWNRPSSFRC